VAIRRATAYDDLLFGLLYETLGEFDLPIAGKNVLLKPNLVSLDAGGCINTQSVVIGAARESLLRLGAKRVMVAEGSALERDTEAILEAARLRDYVDDLRACFVDLNTDDVELVPLRTRASKLRHLYLPRAVLEADFVVSLPKLKTHQWAGVTLSLKNMFGIVPGSCYGWPKNILHWAGITRAVLDLISTVRPDFAIVDGIVGMEGNGPLQGKPKSCGVLVCGDDPVAVDATCARIMGLVPERVDHIAKAGLLLGHIAEERIRQLGEPLATVRTPFEVQKHFRPLRGDGRR
jgi:uncharacterized protein (DUF362 family)